MNCRLLRASSSFALLLAAACSDPTTVAATPKQALPHAAPAPIPPAAVAPVATPPAPASASPTAQAVDIAAFAPNVTDKAVLRQVMIRTQVLLDRAHFSPGVIDGAAGENVRQAIAAFEQAHGLSVDGQMDAQVWAALTTADAAPVLQDYVITQEDVRGPFAPTPKAMEDQAKLQRLGYASAAEALAEKFHMDETLLATLNPGVAFTTGTTIVVARPGADTLPAAVARIEVDKAEREVRAYGADSKLLAVYPATVGSSERPAPAGEWAVRTIAPNPTYSYDPSRLTFGDAKGGKMTIAAGPNNPVGTMWIDLTKDTYGIHGAPEPAKVGKVDSHGCVRLTNWDVNELGSAVKKGAKVVFIGAETSTKPKA